MHISNDDFEKLRNDEGFIAYTEISEKVLKDIGGYLHGRGGNDAVKKSCSILSSITTSIVHMLVKDDAPKEDRIRAMKHLLNQINDACFTAVNEASSRDDF